MPADDTMARVEVMRGRHDNQLLAGPFPGARIDDVVAYDFELPTAFELWPGRTRTERTFVLLGLGVSFANPCWVRHVRPDGTVIDRGADGRETWYVDLVSAEQNGSRYTFRYLYIDVMGANGWPPVPVAGPGRICRRNRERTREYNTGGRCTAPLAAFYGSPLAYGSRAWLHLGGLPTRINSTAADPTAFLTIGEADRVVNRFRRSPRLVSRTRPNFLLLLSARAQLVSSTDGRPVAAQSILTGRVTA